MRTKHDRHGYYDQQRDVPSDIFEKPLHGGMGGNDHVREVSDFETLTLSLEKMLEFDIFRLPDASDDVYISGRLMDFLRKNRPQTGWGFTSYRIPVT